MKGRIDMENVKELLDFIQNGLARNELDLGSEVVIKKEKEEKCEFKLDKRKLIIKILK